MELTLQKIFLNMSEIETDETSEQYCDTVLEVNGEIVSPLRLVLSKQVYEQILKTLDNITPGKYVMSNMIIIKVVHDTVKKLYRFYY